MTLDVRTGIDVRGKSRQRDDAIFAALLAIDHGDLGIAERLWGAHVPRSYEGMLSGQDGWVFNPQSQTYSRDGQEVSDDDRKRLILLLIASVAIELQQLMREMLDGETSIS